MHKVTVEIYGEPYTIRGAAPPAHMRELAVMVNTRMQEIGRKASHLSVTKVAVLAAFHLAHDLAKLQEDYDDLIKILNDTPAAKPGK